MKDGPNLSGRTYQNDPEKLAIKWAKHHGKCWSYNHQSFWLDQIHQPKRRGLSEQLSEAQNDNGGDRAMNDYWERQYQEMMNQQPDMWDYLPGLVFIGIILWMWIKADSDNS